MNNINCNISPIIDENKFDLIKTLILCSAFLLSLFFLRKYKTYILFGVIIWQTVKTIVVLRERQYLDFMLNICNIKNFCYYNEITLDRIVSLWIKGLFFKWEFTRYLQTSDDSMLTSDPYCNSLYRDAINYRVINALDIVEMTFKNNWIFITVYITTFLIIYLSNIIIQSRLNNNNNQITNKS